MINHTEQDYLDAKERVKNLRGFYWNLTSYIVINALLTFLDLRHDMEWDWAYWPLIGWGIGVIFSAIHTFGTFNSIGWEERKINELLKKRAEERNKLK